MHRLLVAFITLVAISFSNITSQASDTKIPLEAFTQLPTVSYVSVSPNGEKLAVMRARGIDGGYIVEVFETTKLSKKPVVLGSEHMEMTSFEWLSDEALYVAFRQLKKTDQGGGNFWAYETAIISADGKGKWQFLPKPKLGGVTLLSLLRSKPNEILLQYESDDVAPQNYSPDVMLYNFKSKRARTVIKGTSKRGRFRMDTDGDVRGSSVYDPATGADTFYVRLKGSNDWKKIKTIVPTSADREDFAILGFSKTNPNSAYVRSNNGQDKAGIYEMNLETLKLSDRLFGLKTVDAGGLIRSSKPGNLGEVIGYTYTSGSAKRYYTDPNEGALYDGIKGLFPKKTVSLESRSDDDNAIVIKTTSAVDPGTYYLLRNKNDLQQIGKEYPLLDEASLTNRKYIKYKARDGRTIRAYLAVPKGEGPFPAIVLPHGGPWARDVGGYDEWVQLLASRGYAVIQPNYRGSTGYGLDHWVAGDANWGLTMQDDLDDAALYMVEKGIARKDKLAMFGWSYGGYAAMMASLRDDNIYQCAVAGASVASLPRWSAFIHRNGRASQKVQLPTVKGLSPVDLVQNVNIPIFVLHGAIDRQVSIEHSREFVSKLKKYKKDYKYTEIEGLDHYSNTFQNQHKVQFFTELTDYLASDKCFAE